MFYLKKLIVPVEEVNLSNGVTVAFSRIERAYFDGDKAFSKIPEGYSWTAKNGTVWGMIISPNANFDRYKQEVLQGV